MNYCGIDVGTSGVKAAVFDINGREIKKAYRAYEPACLTDGRRSLSANDVWDKTIQVLGEVAAENRKSIVAVSVSSFGEAFVLLNEKDKVLYDIMISTDRRGEKEFSEKVSACNYEEVLSVSGQIPSSMYTASKLLYIQKEKPEIYNRIRRILLIGDYIQYRLTGIARVDYSAACRTMLLDFRKLEWSGKLLNLFKQEGSKFSELGFTGEVIGNIRAEVAEEIGLSPYTKVILGGHDQPMNTIGSALAHRALACSMGTSECMTALYDELPDLKQTIVGNLSIEPIWEKGKYCTLAYNPSSGLLIQWFFKTFCQEEKPPYELFDRNMPEEPTKIMVQPYLMGSGTPYMDSYARIAMTGLDSETNCYVLYRALLEGLVLDQRLNLEMIRATGYQGDRLICSGGGARNRFWLRLKADILQMPVGISEASETGALGCAAVCAAALGEYASLEEAASHMTRVKEWIEPVGSNSEFYDEKYELYKKLHDDVRKESEFSCGFVKRQ